MPVVDVESSIHIPADKRVAALHEVAACVVRNMDVHPRQIRARIHHVDPAFSLVGEEMAGPANPWIIVWVSILEGRPEAKRVAFVDDLAGTVAAIFGVEDTAVRVLIQEYKKVHWGIGRRTAAALGR